MKDLIILDGGESAYDCPFGDVDLWVTADILPDLDELEPEHTKLFCFGDDSIEPRNIATELSIPIISTDSYATEPFPKEEIVKQFGIDYFWSPISYMIAYALYLGYKNIGIYGVDLETTEAYRSARTRITFWLGVANGMGIDIKISKVSRLYRTIKHDVRDRYDRAMQLRDGVTPEDYVKAIENHGDPYTFVTGRDRESVTVKNYDRNGKEVSSWTP